jgi:hypothetical protein
VTVQKIVAPMYTLEDSSCEVFIVLPNHNLIDSSIFEIQNTIRSGDDVEGKKIATIIKTYK